MFLYVKALHIIFVVTWFAGLFYIVRLFVYHAEAAEMQEPEKSILLKQYELMQKRLWFGITWPSAVLTFIFGLSLLHLYPGIPIWLIIKLSLVALLYIYHFMCHKIYNLQQNRASKWSSMQLRYWNEVATLFLVSIVFLVVLKNISGLLYGVIGLILFTAVLVLAIKAYKKTRQA